MEDCTVTGLGETGALIVGLAEATLANVQVESNGCCGTVVRDGARLSVSRSVISGHQGGFRVRAETVGTPTVGVITDSVVSHNRQGITGSTTAPGAQVRVVAPRNQVLNGAELGIAGLGLLCADATFVQVASTDNVVQGMTESGIVAFAGSSVVASGNAVTNSAVGLANFAGVVVSTQNNVPELNTCNSSGIPPGTLR